MGLMQSVLQRRSDQSPDRFQPSRQQPQMRRIENCICPTHLGWQNAPPRSWVDSKSESPPPAPHCHAREPRKSPNGKILSPFLRSLRLCGSFIKPVARSASPEYGNSLPDSLRLIPVTSFWSWISQPDSSLPVDPPTICRCPDYPAPSRQRHAGEFQICTAAASSQMLVYIQTPGTQITLVSLNQLGFGTSYGDADWSRS